MKFPWIIDPITNKQSVTVTLVVISGATMLTAIGLELAGMAKGTALVTDFFWGSLAAYLGRRITFGKGKVAGVLPKSTKRE